MEPRHPAPDGHRRSSGSQRAPENDNLSFLDFLRSAGGTANEADRSSSRERKRRHTGTEPQRRDYPYPTASRRTSGTSSTAGTEGSSGDNPVDLTTPPRSRGSRQSIIESNALERIRSSSNRRRSSDMAPPKWQPDSEVSRCPVCQAEFSFWYRKHHCRKCGRVVCATCSPHRITIPRQYIVQPPSLLEQDFGIAPEPESPVSRALGGGAVVRVCNPCVPDPWTPDPTSTPREGLENSEATSRPLVEAARNAPIPFSGERSERYRYVPAPPPPTGARSRAVSHTPVSAPFSSSMPRFHSNAYRDHRHPSIPTSSRPPGYQHRHTQSSSHIPPMPPLHSRPPVSAMAPPRPRRQVKEEDECPVCGEEMPPGEAVREAHVQECIAERFSSTPSSSARPPPAANPDVPQPSGPSTPPAQRPRATSYRPRGMALYKANEKDCTTEDGEPQECVICFEEFQPGDEMGRMECLCKFHRKCIRQWWETKGVGSCPTHQLHE